jgi:hypothetical protein
MRTLAQKVNNPVHSVTVDTSIVSIGEPLNRSSTIRAASFPRSLWPLMVIGIAALSSVLWMFGLLWLLGYAIWQ